MALLSFALPISACFAVLLLVIYWQSRTNSQLKQQNERLKKDNKAQQQVIKHVQTRQTITHQNATAARAELDARLSKRGDYRD